ncbi:MAG: esterase-like activity of phytase family protein [Bacteroidota bacterium]
MKSMVARLLFLFTLVLLSKGSIYSQLKFDLEASYFVEIPSDTAIVLNGQTLPTIGGLSGIDYDAKTGHYLLISDAGKKNGNGRYYVLDIDLENDFSIEFKEVVYLPKGKLRGEGIRTLDNGLLITDERTINRRERSFFFHIDKENNMTEIPLPKTYKKPMWDNSGFEGLGLSEDGNKAFIALERAMPESTDRYMVGILEYNIQDVNITPKEYYYPLQRKMPGNGISEVVAFDDTSLLVIERDWVSPNNYVTLYSVNLKGSENNNPESGGSTPVLKPTKVFSFPNTVEIGNKTFKVNNIEGATFSPDGEFLILVSDNNFGNNCDCTPTQLVFLKIQK